MSRYLPAPLAHVVDDFEGDTEERLAGRVKAPALAVADPDRPPFVYLYAFALRRRPPKGCEGIRAVGDPDPDSIPEDEDGCAILPKGQPAFWVRAGERWHAARFLFGEKRRLFWRSGDCVTIARDLDSTTYSARVYHLRKWVLLLPLAIAALLLAALTFCGSGSGGSSLGFLDGAKSSGDAARNPGNLTCKVTQGKTVWTADEVSTMQDGKDGNARVVGTTAKDSYSITGDVRNSNQFSGEIAYNFTTSKPNTNSNM